MPCYIRMKRTFLQGLLWLYLLGFGFMALSLEPGFLDFDNLPDTNFSCVGKVIGGYYADLETNCQMFHVCTIGQLDEPMDIRFLCLNGTVFDQETRVCERIDEVDCTKSELFYNLNLELYGNSQPSNLEEISETEQPLIIKSTLPTTTTTTEPPRKTTHAPYYTTVTSATNGGSTPQLLSSHHFPHIDSNSPDIRFNPEEINISLHPGAPPDIRTNVHPFFSDKKVSDVDKKSVVTTHRSGVTTRRPVYGDGGETNTQKSLSGYNQATPGDINFGFTFRNVEAEEYRTEDPEGEGYHYHTEFRPSQQYSVPHHNSQHQLQHQQQHQPQQHQSQHHHQSQLQPQQYSSSTFRNDFSPTTSKNNNYQPRSSTTSRNYFLESLKPPSVDQQSQYSHLQSEKPPQRLQLPLPLLPTLPPLTFSSPAPFSLQQRIDTKRYTKDHFPPPRIVVSASASVSDASGRRLNYSLGTIGTAPLFKHPPLSYDEYKEEDVGLDPFYHDVKKVKHSRKRRSTTRSRRSDGLSMNHSDIIKNDEDAIQVLKFLFDWYRNEKTNPARFTTPISAPLNREGIVSINDELSPEGNEHGNGDSREDDNIDFKFKTSDVFNKKSRYSIIGDDGVSVNQREVEKINNVKEEFTIKQTDDPENGDEIFQHEEDYINDNFEPIAYGNTYENEKEYSTDYKHESSKDLGKYDYKHDYAQEKEPSVDYGREFREEAGIGKNSHRHHYGDDEISLDYESEINEGKETSRGDQVSQISDKENETHPSVSNDYVDDNIEPIYYKQRPRKNEIDKITTDNIEIETEGLTTEYSEGNRLAGVSTNAVSTSSPASVTISFSELPDETVITSSFPEEQMSTQGSEDVNSNLTKYETYTSSETFQIVKNPSTTSSAEFETTLTTELPTTTPRKSRNNRRRGRRKYHSAEVKDKEIDFKKVFIEKLIEKPFRAKDDYDYLRTVHIHTTTSGKGLNGNSSIENQAETDGIASRNVETTTNENHVEIILTITETPTFTESSSNGTTEKSLVESINSNKESEISSDLSTTQSTTETLIKNKRRRGKQRSYVESNRKTQSRRRKPIKSTEIKDYYPSSNITYLGSVEIISNTERDEGVDAIRKNSKPNNTDPSNDNRTDLVSQKYVAVDRSEIGNDIPPHNYGRTDSSSPIKSDEATSEGTGIFTESIETTSGHGKTIERGRGKTKFLTLVSDQDQQSTVIEITRTTPLPIIEKIDGITSPSSLTTESLRSSSERIEDIYATSFVPTTESIHITKKKQLRDNLLNSELISTTESTLDTNTIRVTDVTEEFREDTTLPSTATTENLLKLRDETDITTLGYFTDVPFTETVDELEITTTIPSRHASDEVIEEANLIRNESVPSMSKGMNLVSIVVEEKLEDDSSLESTTDVDSTSTFPPRTSEWHSTVADISTGPSESSTDILNGGHVQKDHMTVNQAELVEDSTEAFTSTTDASSEISSASAETQSTDSSTATTIALETTTVEEEYSQIPTTFEQTTFAPSSTDATTTTQSHPRRDRPNRRRPNHQRSSYRHRFSSEYSTKRPGGRKKTIEDELIDIFSRRGKKLTTERSTGPKAVRDDLLTEYPLMKSVHPTQAERTLVTTPFSRKTTIKKHFFFNCFGKEVDKFYPDSRDCRLFHYCTQGYNKNQLLDMKFVCDFNTFFDDEKLICTKMKPKRCL